MIQVLMSVCLVLTSEYLPVCLRVENLMGVGASNKPGLRSTLTPRKIFVSLRSYCIEGVMTMNNTSFCLGWRLF
jgi:hypothetical protein